MNIGDIIFIVLGAFSFLTGIVSLLTGKVYGFGSSAKNYTEESLARYARPFGFVKLLLGAGAIALHVANTHLFFVGSLDISVGYTAKVACLVMAVVICIASNGLLVKKEAC